MVENESVVSQFDSSDKFSPELVFLVDFMANELYSELPVLVMDIDYFILSILNSRASYTYGLLKNYFDEKTLNKIHDSYWQVVSSKALAAVKPGRKIQITPELKKMGSLAYAEMEKMKGDSITSAHMMLALLSDDGEDKKFKKIMEKYKLDYERFRILIAEDGISRMDINLEEDIKIETTPNSITPKLEPSFSNVYNITPSAGSGKQSSIINGFCNNINEMFERGLKEPLIGREDEMSELIISLGRKRKGNVILIGEEGVGKTAIAEHLAERIINGEVPGYLSGKKLLSLNMTALMAGTTYRGQLEERVEKVLNALEKDKNILLIDNIGDVLASRYEDYGIGPMLAHKMESGMLQVIGTADYKSYKKTFEKKMTLARLFQTIEVRKPDRDESVRILMGLKEGYENYHKVKYSDKAIELCVELADKYISEKNLPDSAIDVMDDAGIHKRMDADSNPDLKEIRERIKQRQKYLKSIKREKNADKDYNEIDNVIFEINSLKKDYAEKVEEVERKSRTNPDIVGEDDIKEIISIKTRIPVYRLTSDDRQNLGEMNKMIKKYVIGQDEAVDTICQALKRNRLGLRGNGCLFSGILLGSTGVGKTHLAKTIARMMFGDENAMVRFDMSEYSDKTSVNKLIGSNPGYVGYEDGGQLTEKIKHNKYCVLLMDEIEKADQEVYNLFLQVLDEGFLTDNYGSKIDFRNVIVLFTTNVGARKAGDFGDGIGFGGRKGDNRRRITEKELKNEFPPEFLNRIDEIVYFNTLTDGDLRQIIYIELDNLSKKLIELGFGFMYYSVVAGYLFDKIKDESEYGARPVKRVIKREIENLIADDIIENNRQNGYIFNVDVDDDGKLVLK